VVDEQMTEGRLAMLEAPERFVVESRVVSEPGPGEVRVRVRDCGVCGSDLKMWAGTHAFLRPPLLLGHEVYGIVDALGTDTNGTVTGTPVVVFPAVGCGTCFHCLRDQPQLCSDMRFYGGQLPGGLAEYVVVPEANVIRVPDSVPDEQRVLIEPLAVAVHAVERAAALAGEKALVIGAGAIGLFTALVARARGLEVLVAEVASPRRLRAAALGLDTVDPGETPLAEAVSRLIRPEGADLVFECVGAQPTIAAALSLTRKGGRTVVVGNAPAELQLNGLDLQRGDRSLVGILMYDRTDFVTAIAMLRDGLLADLPPDEAVQAFTLDGVGAAFAAAKGAKLDALRAIVRP
jgi:threonine dehydrogenase-like Zn-dependent dehydrogenase